MKLSRAAQCGGGGSGGRGSLLSSELRDRDRQGCRGHKRDTEGTGDRHRAQVGGDTGRGQECRRNGHAWDRHGQVRRSTQRRPETPLLTQAETPGEILGDPPPHTHTPHFTRSAVTHSLRGGDNPGARWQAGHYLPLRTGVPYLPHLGSACLLLTSAPRLPENRVADGTWGAQVAGAGHCCELSCCCGDRGSCPPGGQKPEPPRGYEEQA